MGGVSDADSVAASGSETPPTMTSDQAAMGDIRSRRPPHHLPRKKPPTSCNGLEPKQVEMVSIEIAKLKSGLRPKSKNKSSSSSPSRTPRPPLEGGGLDRAKNLVQKAFGKNAGGTLDTIRQAIEEVPFAFLRDDRQPEHSHLRHRRASPNDRPRPLPPAGRWRERRSSPACRLSGRSRSFSGLPRWARRAPTSSKKSSTAWNAACRASCSQSFENAGGVGAVAEMLNVADRATERQLMEQLCSKTPNWSKRSAA